MLYLGSLLQSTFTWIYSDILCMLIFTMLLAALGLVVVFDHKTSVEWCASESI